MIQYEDLRDIPSGVRDLTASKISLLDQYILFQTGENEFTALVYSPGLKVCKQYVFTGSDDLSSFTVAESEGDFKYSVSNEYYCCSNVGYGTALELPVTDLAIAHSTVILACALMLAIVFKGVLFPCLRRK